MKRAALAPSAFWKFPTHPEGAAVAGARLTPLADTPRLQTTTPLSGARPTAEPHLLLYFCPVISGPRDRTSQGALAHSFAAARACRALCATRSPGRPCDQDRPLTAPLPPCSSHTSLVCFLAMPVSSPLFPPRSPTQLLCSSSVPSSEEPPCQVKALLEISMALGTCLPPTFPPINVHLSVSLWADSRSVLFAVMSSVPGTLQGTQ